VSHENGTPPEAAIDSHAEESASNAPPLPAPVQAVVLAPRPPAEREVLMPLDPEQVVEGMRQYQQLLRGLLEPSDWQIEDKDGRPLERPFLKKSGWRKITRALTSASSASTRGSSATRTARRCAPRSGSGPWPRTASSATATATARPTKAASEAGRGARSSRTTCAPPPRHGLRTAPSPTWSGWGRSRPRRSPRPARRRSTPRRSPPAPPPPLSSPAWRSRPWRGCSATASPTRRGPGGSASGSPPTTAICRWPWAARCATRPRRLGTRGRPVAVAKRTRGRSGRRTGHSRRAGLAVGRRRVGVLAQKGRYGATSSRLRQRLSVARAQSSGSRRSSSPNSDSCSSARSAAG
jgi:hypothetical protein